MRPNHRHAIPRSPFLPNRKSDERGAVAGEVVFAAGSERRGPGVALFDLGEAGALEAADGGGDGVICCVAVSLCVL